MKSKKFETANAFTVGIISASSIAIVLLFALIISGKLTGVGEVGEGTVNNPYLFETEIPDDTSDMSVIEFTDTNGEIILTEDEIFVFSLSGISSLNIGCEYLETEGYDITVDSIRISAMDGETQLMTVYPTVSSAIGDPLIKAGEKGHCGLSFQIDGFDIGSPDFSVTVTISWHDAEGNAGELYHKFTDFEDIKVISSS